MKFSDMKYQRPPLNGILEEYTLLAQRLNAATTSHEAISLFWQCESVTAAFSTAQNICLIRHTINTKDDFYNEENDFYDENCPLVTEKRLGFYKAMLESPHRAEIEKTIGTLWFEKAALEAKAMNPETLPLMQKENALTTKYEKLCASAQIEFGGKKHTLSELAPHKQSTDRAVRKAAFEAEGKWFDENQKELDEIYDALVKNRTQQAKALGFESFVPLGYIRMMRLGYGEKEVAAFRAEIKSSIVPAAAKIKAKQQQNLEVDKLMLWDSPLYYKNGNAVPSGTAEEIMNAGLKMYKQLSPETAAFMDFMMQNELFDVLSREGKAPGGYCTYIEGYKSPFIYSNFNGTADDVDVLTHEAGHAFAAYIAGRLNLPLMLCEPGLESCEIHSMSMEFLTSDYHHLFFGKDTERYEYIHTADALTFLPYGTMVDEFQHIIYKNPQLTPAQRNEEWAKLEAQYRPWLNMGDTPFYSRGAGWQRQLHIYTSPFYYIDYCLAQSVALQFYAAFLENKSDAWQRYLALTNKAGTETYTGIVKAAGFAPPFEQGVLARVAAAVLEKLKV